MTTSEDDRQSDSETSSSFSLQGSAAAVLNKHDFNNRCFVIPSVTGRDFACCGHLPSKPNSQLSEVEMMKERFAKLLLGEDMSGGGRGVCSALAISNAITNLAASVFGELWKLEPLSPQNKKMWCREMGWLLSVNDSIVDLIPSKQEFPGGGTFEVMSTRVRSDLYMNLPALKKLDAMLLSMLEEFKETEFWYVDRVSDDRVRQEDKWWLPCPRVPSSGLSEEGRKMLQQRRDCTNQILKAAMAINSSVLDEMEIPSVYLDSLPKNGKDCLGDIMYRYITAEDFSPECLLDGLDLSSEHLVLEVANRIEAAIHLWISKDERRHWSHSKSKRSSWSGKVRGLVADNEKNYVLAHRAETLLRTLKLRFPVLPQTVLDMTKIHCNQDVGQAILESYSRVMESLAFNIMARIDDLLFVDDATKRSSLESKPLICRGGLDNLPIQKPMSPSPFSIHHSSCGSSFATASFCLTPSTGSPGRSLSTLSKLDFNSLDNVNSGKFVSEEFERMWLHAGNLSVRSAGDAPERD